MKKYIAILLLLFSTSANAEVVFPSSNSGGGGGGGISVGTVTATGATTARSGASYFSDILNPYDFGAVCNGVTNDSAAFTAFNASNGSFLPPPATLPATTNYCSTTIARTLFPNPIWSFFGGRVADSNGNLLGPIYSRISSPPAQLGNYNAGAITTAFNADFSHVPFAIEHNVTGATTLGQPSSGYLRTYNAYPFYENVYNSSGYNSSTSGNGGRTGYGGMFINVTNAGQGDMAAHNFNGFVNSTKTGATSFLASPEVGGVGGQLSSSVDGSFMELIGDLNASDNGHDDAAMGFVNNMIRTNSTGNLNVNWINLRTQNQGTKAIDAATSFSGDTGISLDLTAQTYPDYILQSIALSNGGTGYTAGDLLSPPDGTADTTLNIKVLTVNGSGTILTYGVERSGKYTVPPAVTSNVTGGTGTSAVFTITFGQGAAVAMPANSKIYMNSLSDSSIYGTKYPSTARMGTSYITWSSALNAFSFVAGNSSILQLYGTQAIFNGILNLQSGLKLNNRIITTGASDTATTSDYDLFWNKATGSASTEYIPACTSGNSGISFVVADEKGDAGTNNITVQPSGGTINGASTYVLNSNYQSISVSCDGANTNYVISDNSNAQNYGSLFRIGSGAITNTANNNAQLLVQNFNDTNYEVSNMGIMASGLANSSNANIWGVGVYGHGYTNGGTRSAGVVGEGLVTATGDTGASIGVRGYADATHASGNNIGLYCDAQNGTPNYCLYMNNGDIYSSIAQTWTNTGGTTIVNPVTVPSIITSSGGRAVQNTASQSTATIAASKASTYIATPAGAITITLAAPTGDGERRRICMGAATVVTWAVTSPATTATIPKTVFAGGDCVELVYNAVAGTPTNSTVTTWYEY